jgi:hypothetical protein
MRPRQRVIRIAFCLIAAGIGALSTATSPVAAERSRFVLTGTIVDSVTQAPIPAATIRVLGTGISTLANDDGRFRLVIPEGAYWLKVTHIAFRSDSLEITTQGDGSDNVRMALIPVPIQTRGVTISAGGYDPAQEIIHRAIRRKREILSRLHDYTCRAYSRVTVRDNTKPDSSLFLITETRTDCFWRQPDTYKEVITARRQTSNLKARENLFSVGQVLNFNRNRIELGRYSVVSPTAVDALDHYNYYLMDTILVDGRPVFQLEMEPKSRITPLFAGAVQIADSTYDVVAVDLGFNEAVDFGALKNPRYVQRLAPLAPNLWMPVEIRFTGDVKFSVPLPGIPGKMSFVQLASLAEYQFDKGIPKGTFDEYVLEVAPAADRVDSALWDQQQMIPLSTAESAAYRRIDSVEHAPKSLLKKAAVVIPAAVFLTAFGDEEFIRFNRVEGGYAGISVRPKFGSLDMNLIGGYAFSAKRWEGSLGWTYGGRNNRVTFGARIYDQIVRRPAMVSVGNVNTTFYALWEKFDGLDYFRESGGVIWAEARPVGHTTMRLGLKVVTQRSEGVNTDFSIFRRDRVPRENPSINEGHMRSPFVQLTYDSRKRIKTGRTDQLDFSVNFIRASARAEWSTPDLLNSDFRFGRYEATVECRFRPPIPGLTRVWTRAGATTGQPPAQSWFVIDHGNGGLFERRGFVTLNENNFVGTSAAAVVVEHSFGRRVLAFTHIPGVERLPFSLTLRGGTFWTDFKQSGYANNSSVRIARRAYSEAGFGLGNLAPFLSPFNLQVWCSWQLSAYDTRRFSIGVDFAM